jgi:ATP-dependent Clp protease ATP-binding subunit ClpA
MAISRRALFGKLNLTLFRALESATAFAKLRGNPYVELTHWVHQLWQLNDGDLQRICRHCQIDPQRVEKDLAASLSALPAGAGSLSDFSHHIGTAIERAWVLSSLEFGGQCIRGGWLLAALLQTPELRQILLGISPAFKSIPIDALTESMPAYIVGSPEDNEGAHDGSGMRASVPGEASGALPDTAETKSALARYCSDLTQRARSGEIDPVIGRAHEIRTMVDILLRRRQNNPLLTGEAGVGKTAVVEGLALAIVNGEVPPALREVRLLSLDVGALLAGASMRGEFESRLKQLLEEASKSAQPVILFVDEVHTLIGAGGQAGTGDAANLLKPALARGNLRTVGATTWSEYKRHIEKDPALTRRFQVLQVMEPEEASATEMVRGLVSTFAQHHGVAVLDEAVRAAVVLSHRYIPSRQLPDKAISLLDTACARVAMSMHTPPAAVEHLRQRMAALETEQQLLAQEGVIAQGREARAQRAAGTHALTDQVRALFANFKPTGVPDVLNTARELPAYPQLDTESPPTSYLYGLYSVPPVMQASAQTYAQLQDHLLLPTILRRMEAVLAQSIQSADAKTAYETLRVYKLLHDKVRYMEEGGARDVRDWVLRDWETADSAAAFGGRASMVGHVNRLFSGERPVQSDALPNEALVRETQNFLNGNTSTQRIYERAKTAMAVEAPQPFTLVRAVGPQAGTVFSRTGGQALELGVPGLFTYDGYHALFNKRLPEFVKRAVEDDDWVMGRGAAAPVFDIVVASNSAMRLTVRDVERAFLMPRAADAPSPEAVTRQLAALRSGPASSGAASTLDCLALAADDVHAIEALAKAQLGDEAPSLKALNGVLGLFKDPAVPTPVAVPANESLAPLPRETRGLMPPCGEPVGTREEVQASIRAARAWFERNEPSSPVAVLLMQAERLVGKRFSQVADSIPLDLLRKWESGDAGEEEPT